MIILYSLCNNYIFLPRVFYNAKKLINLSNLFPLGTYPQLKQIQSTLNIAGYIVSRYNRRWGSNPRTSNQLCSEIAGSLTIQPFEPMHLEPASSEITGPLTIQTRKQLSSGKMF